MREVAIFSNFKVILYELLKGGRYVYLVAVLPVPKELTAEALRFRLITTVAFSAN